MSNEIIILVTYWKGLCHYKMELELVIYFEYIKYYSLVNNLLSQSIHIHLN